MAATQQILQMRPIAPFFVPMFVFGLAAGLLFFRKREHKKKHEDTSTYTPLLPLVFIVIACGAMVGLGLKLPEAGASLWAAVPVGSLGGVGCLFFLRVLYAHRGEFMEMKHPAAFRAWLANNADQPGKPRMAELRRLDEQHRQEVAAELKEQNRLRNAQKLTSGQEVPA